MDTNTVVVLIERLKEVAFNRKQDMEESGIDIYDYQLPDCIFNRIVCEEFGIDGIDDEIENKILKDMVDSNEWIRLSGGFNLK